MKDFKFVTLEKFNKTIVNLKATKTITDISELKENCAFTCLNDILCGSTTIPIYAKGIIVYSYLSPNSDAILIALDVFKNLYLGFKNGKNWTVRTL